MNYKSFADLADDIKDWLIKLPNDYDLIVGVPRSGMLPANLLALYRNLPLTDIQGLMERRLLYSGRRINIKDNQLFSKKDLKVLILDDSVNSGKQMKVVRNRVDSKDCHFDIDYGAVYTSNNGRRVVDNYYEVIDLPRCFEWNIFHHGMLSDSCVDIDGILCRDPTREENDDGHNYKNFVKNVQPYIIPTKKIGWLVTCRLEKYREHTEMWLRKNNVIYNNLVMMDLPDMKARQRASNHAKFKSKIYNQTKAKFFLESSINQAKEIAARTGKYVFCMENNKVYNPGLVKNISVNVKQNSFSSLLNPIIIYNRTKKIFRKYFL